MLRQYLRVQMLGARGLATHCVVVMISGAPLHLHARSVPKLAIFRPVVLDAQSLQWAACRVLGVRIPEPLYWPVTKSPFTRVVLKVHTLTE